MKKEVKISCNAASPEISYFFRPVPLYLYNCYLAQINGAPSVGTEQYMIKISLWNYHFS